EPGRNAKSENLGVFRSFSGARFWVDTWRISQSLCANLEPGRRGLIVCFLQVLFLAQNRLEMLEISRGERSNMCLNEDVGIVGNEPKSEPLLRRAPGWKTGPSP